jgi:hypothetical protein
MHIYLNNVNDVSKICYISISKRTIVGDFDCLDNVAFYQLVVEISSSTQLVQEPYSPDHILLQ